LIAPYVGADGRDSRGRGTGAGEIAAAVAADSAVQREREGRWSYLQGAYRDPHAARAALDELVKTQGWTSAAARVAADPSQLGELRGKEGLFVGGKARAEREAALRAAGAIGPSLERIGAATAAAERAYRASVAQQRAADATGIPRLSAAAEIASGAISTAEGCDRGNVWRAVQADDQVAGELRAFREAVERRFGVEAVRAMQRSEGRAGAVGDPSIAPDQQTTLDRVAALTAGLKASQREAAAITQREAETERRRLRL
jgi:hypothetical protein